MPSRRSVQPAYDHWFSQASSTSKYFKHNTLILIWSTLNTAKWSYLSFLDSMVFTSMFLAIVTSKHDEADHSIQANTSTIYSLLILLFYILIRCFCLLISCTICFLFTSFCHGLLGSFIGVFRICACRWTFLSNKGTRFCSMSHCSGYGSILIPLRLRTCKNVSCGQPRTNRF